MEYNYRGASISGMTDDEIEMLAIEFGKGVTNKTVAAYARRFGLDPMAVSEPLRIIVQSISAKAFASGLRVARNAQTEFEKGIN